MPPLALFWGLSEGVPLAVDTLVRDILFDSLSPIDCSFCSATADWDLGEVTVWVVSLVSAASSKF